MIPRVKIECHEDAIYSPFSGQRVDGPNGINDNDPTVLFVHYGNAGEYGFLSDQLREALTVAGVGKVEDLSPDEIGEKLDVDSAFVLVVDAGWNGVNTYGFAHASD